ncbi:hypothetical protein [Bacteroides pyogenes]|uniref:hypothetical protein n=1 Tax=Bacteroides pyogenes TaxID=310300 RepID=UPI001BAA680E|nr:hypothetical protein [Bacteroides pyogenes]
MYETECDKKHIRLLFYSLPWLGKKAAGFEKKAAGFENKDGRVSESSITCLEMSRESLKKTRQRNIIQST